MAFCFGFESFSRIVFRASLVCAAASRLVRWLVTFSMVCEVCCGLIGFFSLYSRFPLPNKDRIDFIRHRDLGIVVYLLLFADILCRSSYTITLGIHFY